VGVVVSHFGFWSLNAARIVYVMDETEPVRRYGFGYGTLQEHMERGEERFMIEWRADDSVWFEISSFSQPKHWLAWLFYPLSRSMQTKFLREAVRALHHAVTQSAPAAITASAAAGARV